MSGTVGTATVNRRRPTLLSAVFCYERTNVRPSVRLFMCNALLLFEGHAINVFIVMDLIQYCCGNRHLIIVFAFAVKCTFM